MAADTIKDPLWKSQKPPAPKGAPPKAPAWVPPPQPPSGKTDGQANSRK